MDWRTLEQTYRPELLNEELSELTVDDRKAILTEEYESLVSRDAVIRLGFTALVNSVGHVRYDSFTRASYVMDLGHLRHDRLGVGAVWAEVRQAHQATGRIRTIFSFQPKDGDSIRAQTEDYTCKPSRETLEWMLSSSAGWLSSKSPTEILKAHLAADIPQMMAAESTLAMLWKAAADVELNPWFAANVAEQAGAWAHTDEYLQSGYSSTV